MGERIEPSIKQVKQSKVLLSSDLRNASLLIIAACGVLCDPENARNVKNWFRMIDDGDTSEVYCNIIQRIRDIMKNFDHALIKLSLGYFPVLSGNQNSNQDRNTAGSRWIYTVLNSGVLHWPEENQSIGVSPDDHTLSWYRYSHDASAIFRNQGWRHPVLQSAMKGRPEAMEQWRAYEPVVVRMERFTLLREKCESEQEAAITLARMSGGCHEALCFLLENGLESEAIAEASASQNINALALLSKELMSTSPHLSILCMQAHILCAFQCYDDPATIVARNLMRSLIIARKCFKDYVVMSSLIQCQPFPSILHMLCPHLLI
jgi:hypothetical protein